MFKAIFNYRGGTMILSPYASHEEAVVNTLKNAGNMFMSAAMRRERPLCLVVIDTTVSPVVALRGELPDESTLSKMRAGEDIHYPPNEVVLRQGAKPSGVVEYAIIMEE